VQSSVANQQLPQQNHVLQYHSEKCENVHNYHIQILSTPVSPNTRATRTNHYNAPLKGSN